MLSEAEAERSGHHLLSQGAGHPTQQRQGALPQGPGGFGAQGLLRIGFAADTGRW